MKILIVSDTHRHNENLKKVIEKTQPIDLLIHLGDGEGVEEYIPKLTSAPFEIVAGNNDFFSSLSKEIVTKIGKYRVLLTHGHLYNVSAGIENLVEEMKDLDIIMFGHTHKPLIIMKEGKVILNPGSPFLPKTGKAESPLLS